MGSSWRPRRSRDERAERATQSMTPGSAQGRIAQAQPVPRRDRARRPIPEVPEQTAFAIYVQPDEPPDVPIGTLWLDTDDFC